MNTLQLVNYLRKNLLDDTGGSGVAWDTYSEDSFDSIQLRWTNEELVDNINEAITQVYRRTLPITDTYTLSLVAGTNLYELPPYILQVEGFKKSDGNTLRKGTIDEIYHLSYSETESDIPFLFVTDYMSKNIRVYPTPLENEECTLLIYRLPTTSLDWRYPSREPELHAHFQIPMLFYAAHLCYLKDSADTLDPRRASTFLASFDREFPFTSAYSNIRKERTSNRPSRYGGL
jgi:hypothetical protein